MLTTRATGVAGLCLALSLAACSTGGTLVAEGPVTPPAGSATANLSGALSPTGRPPAPSPTRTGTGAAERAIGTGWGPTRAEIRRARTGVSRLSLRELAGQVIVARYAGTAAPTTLVNRLHLGGVIVFGDNIAGTAQIRTANRRLQAAAAEAGRRWPVFVAVDQEGGVVARVQGAVTRFPAFMSAGAARAPRLTRKAYAGSGAELVDLGFTVDLAPVADVTSGPGDPTIGARSAGSRPVLVATHTKAAAAGFASSGILPVVKHFPGHGSVPADSHLELPVQTRSLSRLMRSDLVPFRAAVADGVPAVMVGHIDLRAVDPGRPSSLSRPVVTGLLRDRLGFEGLVVTDALDMKAVTDGFDSAASAVRALRAGADVLLMPPSPRAARDGIVAAVRDGRLGRTRLEQAATRQVAALLHQAAVAPAVVARPGSSAGISRRLSAAAVTVVSGPCRGRLVGRSVRAVGAGTAVARFERAAARAGLGIGRGDTVALLGYRAGPRDADVVVSLDTPYVLGRSRARTARIAVYGETPGAMRALVQVLLGRAPAPGRLPVHVSGVARTGC